MIRKSLFVIAAVAGVMALANCEIYFGPNAQGGSNCSPWDDCEDPAGPGEPGWACADDWACMAGCYCSVEGVCEEAGFCEDSRDCADGFECQVERASCAPDRGGNRCSESAECPQGYFCDSLLGECAPSGGCGVNGDCGPGWECNTSRGTCEPMPCTDDAECFQGCVCNVSPDAGGTTGECVETGFCTEDIDCPDGMVCDVDRLTCDFPDEEEDPGLCSAEVTCTDAAPACDANTYPGIADGCYTDSCLSLDECGDTPPECSLLKSRAHCLQVESCGPVFAGIDCTCNADSPGCDCDETPELCTCADYQYAGCTDLSNP